MSQVIRSKMICRFVEPNPHSPADDPKSTVAFGAVWSPNTGTPEDENAVFGKATPWGEYKASWSKEVADQLVVGKAYYVDIHPAE